MESDDQFEDFADTYDDGESEIFSPVCIEPLTDKSSGRTRSFLKRSFRRKRNSKSFVKPSSEKKSRQKSQSPPPEAEGRKVGEEEFVNELDPKQVDIRVIKYQKKFLGEGFYSLQINFRSALLNEAATGLAPLQNKRTYDDFWAFHIALCNKFKNVRFPELPKTSSLSAFKGSKVHEQRIQVFQKIIDLILLNATQYETLRLKMMTMLYKFAILESTIASATTRPRLLSDTISVRSDEGELLVPLEQQDRLSTARGDHGGLAVEEIEQIPRSHSVPEKSGLNDTVKYLVEELKDQYQKAISQVTFHSLGKVYVRVPENCRKDKADLWECYHAKFENRTQLQFLHDINKTNFVYNYIVYHANVSLSFDLVSDQHGHRKVPVVAIQHQFDSRPLLMTPAQIFETDQDLEKVLSPSQLQDVKSLKQELNEALLNQMEQVIVENTKFIPEIVHQPTSFFETGITMPIDSSSRYPVGKLMVEIDEIENLQWVGETMFVRLTCPPYTLMTKKVHKVKRTAEGGSVVVKQKFYIPVHNYFNSVTLEVFNQLNKGWLREYTQRLVIARFEVRIPDIHLLNSPSETNLNFLSFDPRVQASAPLIKLPIEEKRDLKKLGMKEIPTSGKQEQASLNVRLLEFTHSKSILTNNPNREIREDRKQKENYSIRDISQVLARTKMALLYWDWFLQVDAFVYQFHYPKFSRVAFLCLVFIILMFNPNYILSYLCLIVLLIMFSNSKLGRSKVGPWLHEYFFSQKELHPMLRSPNQVKKANDISYQSLLKQLREEQALPEDLKQLKEDYSIQESKGLLNKYRDMKKGTASTLNVIDKYCDYFEKYKNLVQWEDPHMSFLFFIIAIGLFLIVTFLPIRFFLLGSQTYRFYKGQRWHTKRVRNNREICKVEIANFLTDLKIHFKADYEEILDWQWEKILSSKKKDDDNFSLKGFQQKLVLYMQRHLKVYLPRDILKKECPSPASLMEYFSRTPFVIRQRILRNDDIDKNPNIYKKGTPFYMYLPIFVMNRIPTDIYRLKNPKMEIKLNQQTGEKYATLPLSTRKVAVQKHVARANSPEEPRTPLIDPEGSRGDDRKSQDHDLVESLQSVKSMKEHKDLKARKQDLKDLKDLKDFKEMKKQLSKTTIGL